LKNGLLFGGGGGAGERALEHKEAAQERARVDGLLLMVLVLVMVVGVV
jgi:hypothetical protein